MICDAQVHAPRTPHLGPIPGMEPDALLREMDGAGVDRCVVVPMMPPPGNELSRSNEAALAMAADHSERFAVMGLFDLTSPQNAGVLATWRGSPGMLGIRLAFLRDPNLAALTEHRLEWFWTAAERAGVPIMLLAPDSLTEVDRVAAEHPGLRLVVDHLNLHPSVRYGDVVSAVRPLLALARHANVAVKASALPCWAPDAFPFRSVHGAVGAAIDAFGANRVFWGSDLSRLPVTYAESIKAFTEEMPFLSAEQKEWVMGRGVVEWLGWDDRAAPR